MHLQERQEDKYQRAKRRERNLTERSLGEGDLKTRNRIHYVDTIDEHAGFRPKPELIAEIYAQAVTRLKAGSEKIKTRDFISAETMETELREAVRRGYEILQFAGLGYSRAAFLIRYQEETWIMKVPVHLDGVYYNSRERQIWEQAQSEGDGQYFAEINIPESSNPNQWILQEVCQPEPLHQLSDDERARMEVCIDRYNINDAQGGWSKRDGSYKLYDYSYPTE